MLLRRFLILGKYYSVNVPLEDGVDDNAFLYVFKPIISKIMEIFDPGAVVLQCGADSLTGDRLGTFNVTLKGKYINKKKEGKDFDLYF